MAVGQQGAVELGTVVNLAGETSRESMYQARGEAGLLGEALGIHLPRHVRSFIAELPGVGVALSAAFQATAVLFIISAVVELIEKMAEWAKHAEEVAAAWDKVDTVQRKVLEGLEDGVIRSQIKLDELTGKHLEALRLKLQLIDNVSLSKLQAELEKIAAEADKAFALMDRNWFQKLVGLEGAENVQTEFDKMKKSVDSALNTRTPQAFAEAMKLVDGQAEKAKEELKKLDEQQKDFEANREKASVPVKGIRQQFPAAPDPVTIQAWEELKNRVEGYRAAILDAQTAEKNEKKIVDIQERAKAEAAQKKAAEEAFKIYKDIFSARQAMEKDLEKQLEANAKIDDGRLKAQLKEEENAGKEKLALLKQQEQAAIAEIDGEVKGLQVATQTKSELLKSQYNRGEISGRDYLAKVQKLYKDELDATIVLLNKKLQLVVLEAQNEAAARGKILTLDDAKQLREYQNVAAQKAAALAKFNLEVARLGVTSDKVLKQKPTWDKFFTDLTNHALKTGQAMKTLGQLTADGIGTAVEAAVSGSDGFGQAMEKMLKSALASLAGHAVVKALEEVAFGFSDLANPLMEWHAPLHFHAAAEWGAVAAIAGAAGAAVPGGGSGSSGGGKGSGTSTQAAGNTPATAPEQQPVQVINVQHLASGALVSSPTLAVVGDSRTGGSQREAVIPWDDDRAIDQLRQRLGLSGGTIVNFQIQGLLSADHLHKVARRLSRDVSAGKLHFNSSNSFRITKRG